MTIFRVSGETLAVFENARLMVDWLTPISLASWRAVRGGLPFSFGRIAGTAPSGATGVPAVS